MRFLRALKTATLAVAIGVFLCIGPLTGISYAVDLFSAVWPFWSVDTTTAGIGYFNGSLLQFGTTTTVPAHISTAQTTAPVLTSCGTGSPTIVGTDTAGTITMGTSATGCVLTFNVAYTVAPICVVTWIATPLASQSYVTAAATITLTQTSASGNVAKYICIGQAGG